MARPKKGTKGHIIAVSKWRETMLKKYGGEEGLHQKMVQTGAKGGKAGCGPDYKGGFAGNHERARIAGAKGGKISRRGPSKKRLEDEVQRILEQEMADGRDS